MEMLFHTRGGVMFWADSLGAKYVYDRLDAWSKDYGEFFRPCEYLAVRARHGASLVKDLEHHVLDFASLPNEHFLILFFFLWIESSKFATETTAGWQG